MARMQKQIVSRAAVLNLRPFDFWRPFELVNVAFWLFSNNKNLVQFQSFMNYLFTNFQVYYMIHDC